MEDVITFKEARKSGELGTKLSSLIPIYESLLSALQLDDPPGPVQIGSKNFDQFRILCDITDPPCVYLLHNLTAFTKDQVGEGTFIYIPSDTSVTC
jgi:hypothetical protein